MSNYVIDTEHRVTPLELFFDLVFVFAFTQVTTLWAEDVTWGGLGRGLLALILLWWAWASYAWLTNTVDADAGKVVAVVSVAIAAMFVAALAVPDAFGTHRLVFGAAFFIVMVTFVGLFALAGRGERDLFDAVLRLIPTVIPGASLILAAAFVPHGVRPVLWLLAIVLGFLGPLFQGLSGWRVHAAHFAERHGLILIIAIGESLAAIGIGARGTALGTGVIVAVVLGLVVAASFWLGYFDYFSTTVEQLISERDGVQRIRLARDLYSYLHLPMVVGITLFAFGMKTTVAHVSADLHIIPAVALCGGPALYLLAFVALRWRVSRSIGVGRSTASLCLAALTPLALVVPALAILGLVTAIWLGLHAYELIWWREERARRRARAPLPV